MIALFAADVPSGMIVLLIILALVLTYTGWRLAQANRHRARLAESITKAEREGEGAPNAFTPLADVLKGKIPDERVVMRRGERRVVKERRHRR